MALVPVYQLLITDVVWQLTVHCRGFNCWLFQCPIEWFHFACVGLTTKPKGKWYCPRCTAEKKKKG